MSQLEERVDRIDANVKQILHLLTKVENALEHSPSEVNAREESFTKAMQRTASIEFNELGIHISNTHTFLKYTVHLNNGDVRHGYLEGQEIIKGILETLSYKVSRGTQERGTDF